jgi:hypothetical protein
MPAFEGLLEEPHNKRLMKLLYRTAEWHGFAKLRIHTDFTLDHLEELTKEFGLLMRQFRDLSCSQFQTVELPREVEGRKRRRRRAQAKQSPASTGVRSEPTAVSSSNTNIPVSTAQPTPSTANANATATTSNASPTASPTPAASSSTSASRKLKTLNIFTYKFHSLGDYVRTIRLFGGTDSFSTQLVRFFYSGYYFVETDLGYFLG